MPPLPCADFPCNTFAKAASRAWSSCSSAIGDMVRRASCQLGGAKGVRTKLKADKISRECRGRFQCKGRAAEDIRHRSPIDRLGLARLISYLKVSDAEKIVPQNLLRHTLAISHRRQFSPQVHRYALAPLGAYVSSHLPCCALIFSTLLLFPYPASRLPTYPAVPLFFFFALLLCP